MRFQTYTLDLCGEETAYKGAKSAYRAGQSVVLYYTWEDTDTDYTFLLDGQPLKISYRRGKGFRVAFRMPERDARLRVYKERTMVRDLPPDLMLVDYYEAAVATEGGGGHYELVLSSTEDAQKACLEQYIKEDGESEEGKTTYLIPFEAVDKAMGYIKSRWLFTWNERPDGVSLDGGRTVLKFWNGSCHVRVSTDHMPKNGETILKEIRGLLERYLKEDYVIST